MYLYQNIFQCKQNLSTKSLPKFQPSFHLCKKMIKCFFFFKMSSESSSALFFFFLGNVNFLVFAFVCQNSPLCRGPFPPGVGPVLSQIQRAQLLNSQVYTTQPCIYTLFKQLSCLLLASLVLFHARLEAGEIFPWNDASFLYGK